MKIHDSIDWQKDLKDCLSEAIKIRLNVIKFKTIQIDRKLNIWLTFIAEGSAEVETNPQISQVCLKSKENILYSNKLTSKIKGFFNHKTEQMKL